MNDHTKRSSSPVSPNPRLLAERTWLRGYARRRFRRFDDLVPREELESLADLGFVLAARRYDRDREAAFATYARWWVDGLLRRAVRRAMEHERRRRAALFTHPDPTGDEHEGPRPTPETLAWLRRTLERLSAKDRALVLATVIEGRSARSLAPSLGVSARQAQRLAARALTHLREAAGVKASGPAHNPIRAHVARARISLGA